MAQTNCRARSICHGVAYRLLSPIIPLLPWATDMTTTTIDLKVLDPRIADTLPAYATPGSAGLDLRIESGGVAFEHRAEVHRVQHVLARNLPISALPAFEPRVVAPRNAPQAELERLAAEARSRPSAMRSIASRSPSTPAPSVSPSATTWPSRSGWTPRWPVRRWWST